MAARRSWSPPSQLLQYKTWNFVGAAGLGDSAFGDSTASAVVLLVVAIVLVGLSSSEEVCALPVVEKFDSTK